MSTSETSPATPLVSIIIPVHNRKDYVQTAIQSSLEQTYPNIEVIVIDDASTDDTYTFLQQLNLPIVLLQNDVNKGPSGSRNTGIKASQGEYLFFLDSDDALHRDGIATLYNTLQTKQTEDKTWGIAYGKLRTCDAHLKPIPVKPKVYMSGDILAYLLQGNPVRTGSYLVRKSIVTEVEGFHEDLFDHEDFLFYCLLATKYKFIFIDQYISKFRRHEGDRARHNFAKILKPDILHLDYFFAQATNLKPEILELKNKLYANEHLRMAKIAWRGSMPKEYLFHWRKAISYQKRYCLHPKFLARALISSLNS